MRIYYEAIEESDNEPLDFARIDVTHLNANQRNNTIDDLKLLFAGLNYRIFVHYCYHDADVITPCIVEVIP